MIAPLPSFDHLATMSDDIGTFEHADHTAARRHEGYCTDDMARLLVAVAREPQPGRASPSTSVAWRSDSSPMPKA